MWIVDYKLMDETSLFTIWVTAADLALVGLIEAAGRAVIDSTVGQGKVPFGVREIT